jgi:hypothetical protein
MDARHIAEEAALSGTLAGLLSAAVLLACGRRETGSAAAPVNAESRWLRGDEALREDRASLRHTLTGFVTHQLSTVFWAGLFALVRPRTSARHPVRDAVLGGIATSATAVAIDYTLVPKRLRPGFEERLSTGSTVGVFAAIAAGIALGTLLIRKRD